MYFRCSITRVTNEKTRTVEEFTYLEIVDLDESSSNKLVTQSSTDSKTFYKCPHHIVEKVIKIVDEQIKRQKYQEEPKALQNADVNLKSITTQNRKIIDMMVEIKAKLDNLGSCQIRKSSQIEKI